MRPTLRWALFSAIAIAAVAPQARADDFVDRVDSYYKDVAASQRSDTVLLPLLVKVAAPPAAVASVNSAALLPASSASFVAASAWATAEPQKDALEALKKVTSQTEWKKAFAFAQPYSFAAVDPDLVIANAYTFLGDPPTLASARHLYLPLLNQLASLVHVEATRLAAEGKPADALDLVIRLTFLARSMADRAFMQEQTWGYDTMVLGLQRLRDIAYVDSRSANPVLTPDQLKDITERLQDRAGLMGTDRLLLPRGDKVAAEQIISQLFIPRGGPNPDTFGRSLARIGSKERPLRLFSETARWDGVLKLHANELDARAQLEAIYNDWAKRWQLSPFEPIQRAPSDYSRLDKTRYAALDAVLGDLGVLTTRRLELRAEMAATRTALGMYAFARANRTFPRDITAIRPSFLAKMDADPFSPEGKNPEFFVPIRDALKRPNEDPKPHEIQIFPATGDPFAVSLRDDQFVIFLIGSDRAANNARKATQMVEDRAGDFLVWPPVLSLVRQNLTETGRLN